MVLLVLLAGTILSGGHISDLEVVSGLLSVLVLIGLLSDPEVTSGLFSDWALLGLPFDLALLGVLL